MMTLPSPRITFLLQALLAVAAMAFALFLQHHEGLEPCPLCIFQRLAVIGFGLVALLAWLHGPALRGRRLYAGLQLLPLAWGLLVAGRHVWLQHLPADQVPSCGPGLDYWMAALPWQEVIRQVFQGSGECAKIDWTLFGLSLPMMVLMLFVACLGTSLWQLLRRD